MYLFNMRDEPIRPATQEEISRADTDGGITIDGIYYYLDEADEELLEEWRQELQWRQEWREEIANEEGMLHGCDAYNAAMGWD
jgi:hypothetical protein